MNQELRQAVDRVARRFREARLWTALALIWLIWCGVGVVLAAASRTSWGLTAGLVAMAGLTAAVAAWLALRSARDRTWVARRIEAKHPELGAGLLAAVEQADAGGRPGFLQAAVIRGVLDHRRRHDWDGIVPAWRLRGAKLAHAAALAALVVVCSGMALKARSRGNAGPAGGTDAGDGIAVEPGNTEIERGTPLLVVARFRGATPSEATLVVRAGKSEESRRAMIRSLDDPTFAARVESVDRELSYRVDYDGRRSKTFRVRLFDYPAVVRTDARLEFPGYTGLGRKTLEDVRHVTAVEGTRLTLACRLNKSVATARLVDKQGAAVDLVPEPGGEPAYAATMTLAASRRFRVELVDFEGRKNRSPVEIAVNVVKNRPAVVTASRPARDVRVSPIEELATAMKAEDDFGVVRHGLGYTLAGREPQEIVLGQGANEKRIEASHLLEFEKMAAEPDQLLSYHFWAEDFGPEGERRRTSSDLFFAEVRPFDEVFREGEPPAGGSQPPAGMPQGSGAQQAMQLAELQKEIVNATWGLLRRETGTPSQSFGPDVKTVADSQTSAIGQAEALAGQLQDEASRSELSEAVRFMREAAEALTKARDAEGLRPPLAAEQAAYQALLKLRDREFSVARGGARQQGGGAGSPSQQQLQQLELSSEENRYEERRSAQERSPQEDDAQRETRQVLNRLRELARRQEDLNDRLKELQAALQAAEDRETREELERQLKRLRDQEQQILRDTDELRERMEREANRHRMAEARERVEESRERVRRASEALEQGRTSQALTEGARAGQEFDELSEQMRREAANQFSERMTELRDDARRLDDAQREITDRLEAAGTDTQRSLRGGVDRDAIRREIGGQQDRLQDVLERSRRTIQEAEEPEPLLAEKLFDAVQEAERRAIPDSLQTTDRLADLGIAEEAAKASRNAAEGTERLREGIEAAAGSVLGDETEALKRARSELEDLADQLGRELSGEDRSDAGAGRGSDVPAGGGRGEADDRQPQRQGGQSSAESAEANSDDDPAAGAADANVSPDKGPAAAESGDDPPTLRTGGPGGSGGATPDETAEKGTDRTGPVGEEDAPAGGAAAESRSEPANDGNDESNESGRARGESNGRPRSGAAGGQTGTPGRAGLRGGAERPPGGTAGAESGRDLLQGLDESQAGTGPAGGGGRPITGEGFREWSDRMRDVEELLTEPDLRAEAARIRDRARGVRDEFKRHAKPPDPKSLNDLVAEPLRELRDRVAEEVRRRESPDALVPIDRDPVPPAYAEGVRRYYERLGTGR